MNHIFRSIWSDVLNTWVAVSEITGAKGKRSGSCVLSAAELADSDRESAESRGSSLFCTKYSCPGTGGSGLPATISFIKTFASGRSLPHRLYVPERFYGQIGNAIKSLALALACCYGLNAQANPFGAQVVNGAAAINQSGNLLTITNSPNAIINWKGFSIGSGETTNFVQQSAGSSILNRVIGADPSALLGAMTSNGKVFLINPAGIMVGQGARIDVGGLVASTLNLSNADFLAGKLNLTSSPSPLGRGIKGEGALVTNNGTITTPEGGTVYLVAPQIENHGIINSPKGEVILAAGNTVQLIDTATPGVTVQVTGSSNTATNLGQILADSGRIGMVGAVVRNSGTINANSMVSQGGRVFLKASQDTYVEGQGSIEATGTTGGSIDILGNRVAVTDNASLDASGTNGGGMVLVGGDAHGANTNIQNAQAAFVGSNATIKADATQDGNGGKTVVWADGVTQFNGNISAQGGAQSGNGGWVETSGKKTLGFTGLVNTTAVHGITGTLLLDPTDIVIWSGANTGTMTWIPGTLSFTDTVFTTSDLNTTTLQNQLALTNVTVDTTSALLGGGNIMVQNAIAWNSAFGLTLKATGAGVISTSSGATITNLGSGGLTMQTVNGGIVLNTGAGVLLTNGAFIATAGGTFGAIGINAPVNTGSGTINLMSTGTITEGTGGSLTTSGLLTTSSAGGTALSIANAVGSFNATNSTSGDIALTNTAAPLAITGITQTTGGVNVTVNNSSAINVSGAVTAGGAGIVSLTGVGVTNTSTITGPGGVTINAGTGTLVNSSTGTITNGGSSTGPINLIADNMTLAGGHITSSVNGSVTNSNAGIVALSPFTPGRPINLGTTLPNSLNLQGSDLQTITAANGLVIGGIANCPGNCISWSGSGGITVSSPILSTDLPGISISGGPWGFALFTSGNIAVNAALTSPANVSLNANGTVTETGSITASSLTASAVGGITLNGANTVGSFNATNTTSGNIALNNTASSLNITGINNTFATGSDTVINTGAISISGTIAAAGSGAVNLTALGATGSITEDGTGGLVNTTGLLTTSSVIGQALNGITLGNANTVSSFNATNTGSGGISLTNAVPLTIAGITQTGGGAVNISNTGNITTSGLIAADGNINIFATGNAADDVTISNGINYTGTASAGTLTIEANRHVIIQTSPIQATGAQALNVILNSDRNADNSGAVGVLAGGNILSNGGNITIGGGSGTISAGTGFAHGDYQALGVTNGVTVFANLTAAGGNIVINGIADVTTSGFAGPMGVQVSGGSTVSTTGTGAITLTGQSMDAGAGESSTWGVDIGNTMNGVGTVTSVNGAILINGTSGSASNTIGVFVNNNSAVQATGLGNITINGTVGNNAAANGWSRAVDIEQVGVVSTNSGILTLNGVNTSTAVSVGNLDGVEINGISGDSTVSSTTGAIRIIGSAVHGVGTGVVVDQPTTAIKIGNSTSGNISITSPNASGISLTGAAINTTGTVTLNADPNAQSVSNSAFLGTVTYLGTNTVTAAATNIYYNPTGSNAASPSYATPTTFANNANVTYSNAPTAYMLVNEATQLQAMSTNLAGVYALGTNIPNAPGFTPVGTSGSPFTGTFDGLGHTISSLSITLPTTNYVGLFGYTGASSVIRNVGLVGGSVSGQGDVGALVGDNFGLVSSAYSTGGTVTGAGGSIGGLVGYNPGSINNSYSTNSVNSPNNNIGGLVGYNNYSISNSYATGNVTGGASSTAVGGLVGYNSSSSTVSNTYATGSVSVATINIGGLVGRNDVGGAVSASFWNTSTSGIADGLGIGSNGAVAGVAGTPQTGVSGLTPAQMMAMSSFTGWNIARTGGSTAVWRIYEGNTAPLLRSFLTPLKLTTAPDVTVTYDGNSHSGGTGCDCSISGSPATGTNAGFYNGYFSNQQGYDIIGGNLTISPLQVMLATTVALTGTKVYDGTTTFSTGQLAISDKVGNDVVSLSAGTADTSSKNVGTWAFTSFSNLALTGAQASNYTLTGVSGSGTITPLALSGSITAGSSVYGAALTPGTVSLNGVVTNDIVSAGVVNVNTTGHISTSGNLNAGSYTGIQSVSTLTGADAGNYTFAGATGDYTVTAKAVTLTAPVVSKIYDGGLSYTPTAGDLAALAVPLVAGDTVTAATIAYTDKNAGAGNKTVNLSAATISDGNNGNNYSVTYAGNSTSTITPLAVTVVALTGNKVYDGTPTFSTGQLAISDVVSGDVVSLSAGTASAADKNVGANKPFVSFSGLELTGAAAGNYTLTGVTGTGTITVRPTSIWSGKGGDNLWSNPLNWDALPDGKNVLAVEIPDGARVTYDNLMVPPELQKLTSAGNLAVNNNLGVENFNQSAGSLTGTGNLNVSNSFSQTGGTITLGGSASITQATGNLNIANLGASTVNLVASNGAITQSGPIVTPALSTQSVMGTTLTDVGNRIGNFQASNSTSGDISLLNTSAPLTLSGITNLANPGGVIIENTGKIRLAAPIRVAHGKAKLTAHSPITIDSTVTADGIELTAGATTAAGDDLTVNGSLSSTGGDIALSAGDNLVQNANVSSNGGSVTATAITGGISMALGTSTSTGGGALAYAAPKGDVVLAVLNAGSGGAINLSAGGNVSAAPGSTGANITGGIATINVGGKASFSTAVQKLDATVNGNFAITDTSGTVFSNTATSAPVVQQLITTATASSTNLTSNSSGIPGSNASRSSVVSNAATNNVTGATGDSTTPNPFVGASDTIGGKADTFGGMEIGTNTTGSGVAKDTGASSSSTSDKSPSGQFNSGNETAGSGGKENGKPSDKDKDDAANGANGSSKDHNKDNKPSAKLTKC